MTNNSLPLPFPYLPGEQKPDSFEDRTQQNMDALAIAVGALLNGSGLIGLRIVRGTITGATGAVAAGTGWTAVRNSAGDYTITFTSTFSGSPSVTANCTQGGGAACFVSIVANTASTTRLQVVRRSDGAPVDENVHFHATGSR